MLDVETLLTKGRQRLTPQHQQGITDTLRLWRVFLAAGPWIGSSETANELNVYAFREWRQDHQPRAFTAAERAFLAEFERQEAEDAG